MSDLFADLPWFLQEYVHNNRWTSFRNIQLDTYEAFRSTEGHILISAGTSSGKTEAAMFPVIASVYGQCQEGISVLYVGPLKALIDDQFERIEPILRDSGIRITGWHGDISQYRKDKTVKDPSGILQITPESLQNIVTNRRDELTRLYNRRRYVEDLAKLDDDSLDSDLTIFSIDINGLKVANDTKGHAAGDELIKGAADCLALSIGQSGRVYRIGGDEFMAIVHTEAPEDIREAIRRKSDEWHGMYVDKISLSIGYAALENHPGATVNDLEHLADSDMYAEKDRYYQAAGIDRRHH